MCRVAEILMEKRIVLRLFFVVHRLWYVFYGSKMICDTGNLNWDMVPRNIKAVVENGCNFGQFGYNEGYNMVYVMFFQEADKQKSV